jgi:hypothetical protein
MLVNEKDQWCNLGRETFEQSDQVPFLLRGGLPTEPAVIGSSLFVAHVW